MIEQITKLFNSELDHLEYKEDCIIIHLKNGQIVPLYNSPIELETDIPCCDFCGEPALGDVVLFKKNNHHICSACTGQAISAFIKNKVNIDIKIEDKELKDTVDNMINNFKNVK